MVRENPMKQIFGKEREVLFAKEIKLELALVDRCNTIHSVIVTFSLLAQFLIVSL
jgi:hypothetical protein